MKRLLLILLLWGLWGTGAAQDTVGMTCREQTTVGDDFWVTFIPNSTPSLSTYSVIATGLNDATITVSNPQTGWNTTVSHTAGTKTYIELPGTPNIPSAVVASLGFHVTSTADISLYASNFIADSWDLCNILPSGRLTSQYIVQDYPNNSNYAGGMALVATEDNSVFTMVLPCAVENLSLPVGSTYTVTLNAGQTLALRCGANAGFSGMTVTSNGKPFALFQGHTCARVGTTDTQRGRDHLVEQAIPLDWWGREFVVVSEQARTEGDQIRITASTDGTVVNILGLLGNVTSTLNAGQTYEYHLPANSAAYITSTGPVYVCKYLASFDKYNATSLGDPASVDIPPVHNWLCNTTFPVHNCNNDPYSEQYITSDGHYLDIVTFMAARDSVRLDGQLIPAAQFTPLPGTPYCYYQGPATLGAHTLENPVGPFYATVSGHARWVGYAFLTGMALEAVESLEPIRDTVSMSDSVCQGSSYHENGFSIDSSLTQTPGTFTFIDSTVDNLFIHYRLLTLTVLPTAASSETRTIIYGDTLVYNGDTLTLAGSYPYHYTAANGCDSVVTLVISYASVTLSASAEGVCANEDVILTAEGMHSYHWSSSPHDPSLDSQQGANPITVHPETMTVYSLVDEAGNIIASVVVGVEPDPILCYELSRPFIDFDYPIVIFTDCSEGAATTSWSFSDGVTINAPTARRQFHHPLPDSIFVTLTCCNRYNCCVDSTFTIPSKIRSIWFPNVFTPGQETENRFGGITTVEVAEYSITIYNRWGLEVWSSTDINELWDGTCDGEPLPQGAYVYQWHLKDTSDYRKNGTGTVLLLR